MSILRQWKQDFFIDVRPYSQPVIRSVSRLVRSVRVRPSSAETISETARVVQVQSSAVELPVLEQKSERFEVLKEKLRFAWFFHHWPRPAASGGQRTHDVFWMKQRLLACREKYRKAERAHSDAVLNYELSIRAEANLKKSIVNRVLREAELAKMKQKTNRYRDNLDEMCYVALSQDYAPEDISLP
jgi:hypothetical protein